MIINTKLLSCVALFAISASDRGFAATLFGGIHTFGDSLTDVGNTSLATGGLLPGAAYSGGRFSNGPLWVETLAGHLGLAAPTISQTGGTGHAWAGALTGGVGLVPTIQQQALAFVGAGGSFAPNDLVVLWGGANDFFAGVTDPTISAGYLTDTIATLAGGGAKTILVLNLPDLGDTPELLSTGDPAAIAGFSQLSIAFNLALAASIPALEAGLGIDIRLLDIYAIGKELKNNPGAYGFTNTSLGALTSDNVENAGEFIYWDAIHPTTRVHDIFAARAFALIPESTTAAMLVLFTGSLALRRTRRTHLTR